MKINFTYDLDYIIDISSKIEVEKIIMPKEVDGCYMVQIGNKWYNKHELIQKDCDNIHNNKFLSIMKQILKEKYPDGCTLDKTIFQELAKEYVNKYLLTDMMECFNYDEDNSEGYVQCNILNKRYYCNFGGHYDGVLYFIAAFFGIDDIIEEKYSNEDVVNFVKEHIKIISGFGTTKEKIINSILAEKNLGFLMSIIKEKRKGEELWKTK